MSDDDYAHMGKVLGYAQRHLAQRHLAQRNLAQRHLAQRHLAQRPSGDVSDTTWRYSLMNWGHDPTKS